jgi:integrase
MSEKSVRELLFGGLPVAHYPKPFYRAPRRLWYVQIDGKQINLGPDEAAAHRRYHELMAIRDEPTPDPAPTQVALAVELLDAFLEWVQINRAPKCYDWYHHHLQTFASSIPKALTVAQLRPFHVTSVCDKHADWKANTRHGFCRAVQRAFRWAERQGRIDRSPIAVVEKPAPETKDIVVAPEEYAKVLGLIPNPRFRELVEMAWETGARPQELRVIQAKHVDLENGRIVFPPKESKGKKLPRVVYLTDEAKAIAKRLIEEHPTGVIFRNSEGAAWTKDAINCAFCRLQKKLGRKIHLGAFRKSWATEALKNGVDVVTAASLLGHRDTSMLAKTYAKIQQDPEHMRNAMRRAKGNG